MHLLCAPEKTKWKDRKILRMRQDIIDIIKSWNEVDSELNSLQSLYEWIEEMNLKIAVDIRETGMKNDSKWLYNRVSGYIENRMGSFFSIRGIRFYREGRLVLERPIIYQPEIGYLGIIGKRSMAQCIF